LTKLQYNASATAVFREIDAANSRSIKSTKHMLDLFIASYPEAVEEIEILTELYNIRYQSIWN